MLKFLRSAHHFALGFGLAASSAIHADTVLPLKSPSKPEVTHPFVRGTCVKALEYKDEGRNLVLNAEWARILDLLPLTAIDRDWAHEFVDYFGASFAHTAAGLPLGDLRAPFLAAQGRALLRLYDEVIEQRESLLESHARDIDRQIKYLRGAFPYLAAQKYKDAPDDVWHARAVLAEKERDAILLKQSYDERLDDDWKTLVRLRDALAVSLNLPQGPNLSSLLHFQIFALALIQDVESSFGLGDNPRGAELWDLFSLNLRFDHHQIRAWAKQIARDPVTSRDCGTVGMGIRRRLQLASQAAVVVTPVIGQVSPDTRLALGFLPFEFLPLSFDPEKLTESFVEPWNATPIWQQTDGKINPYKGRSQQWTHALNKSWNNWYLLLGGQLRPAAAIHQPLLKRAVQEDIVHAILHLIRYETISNNGLDWSDPTRLLEHLFEEVFTESPNAPPKLDRVIIDAVERYLESIGRTRSLKAADVAAGLDLMIARLLSHPGLPLKDTAMFRSLRRAPLSAASRRLSEAHVWKPPQIEDRRGRPQATP